MGGMGLTSLLFTYVNPERDFFLGFIAVQVDKSFIALATKSDICGQNDIEEI